MLVFMMKMIIIGLLLFIQTLCTCVNCEEIPPPDIAITDDSTGRSILSAGFWFLIQQALLISLIVLATVYAVYTLIIPFAFGQINAKRSLNDRISSVSDFVFKRNDPQTLTYTNEEQPSYYGYHSDVNKDVYEQSNNEDYEYHLTEDDSGYVDHKNLHNASDRSSTDRMDGDFTHVVDGTNWIQMITMGVWAYGWVILAVQFLLGLTLPPNIQDYLTIFPFKREASRSLKDSYLMRALESIDPVDLTFGVMNINEDQCRLRAICQLRKTVATMPLLQLMYDSYFSTSINMDKYQEAIDAGEALEDCYRLFSNCKNDPYDKLPAIF